MQSLGQKLREEREKRGLSIDQVAAALRIGPNYFHAIEEDRRDDLPGGFFYRSFVRQYARYLELPESDYASELSRALEDDMAASRSQIEETTHRKIDVPPLPTGVVDRAKETRKWVIGVTLLVLVIAGASALYQVYLDWRPADSASARSSETMTPPVMVPESKAQAQAPASPSAANPAGTTASPQIGVSEGQTPATAPGGGVAAPPPSSVSGSQAPATDASATHPSLTAGAAVAAPASGPVQVSLTALDLVWVDVVADGKRVLMRALQAGETQNFGAGQAIRMRTGNAGGLRVVYNGKAIENIGPKGQVRTVTFTPQNYQIQQPLPPVGASPKPATPEEQPQQN